MYRYVIKRILWLIPIIIVVSLIVYALMDLAPGTIIDSMITDAMTEEDIAALRAKYDLDKPMLYRYGKYMFNLVQGDLGTSKITNINVWETYIGRLPNTLILALAALVIGSIVAIPLGILAARRAGTLVDNAVTLFTLLGMSMPGFWLGLLLLLAFSYRLGWLPAGGYLQGIKSLILPAICSGLILMATCTRQTRSSMLEVLSSDYLRTARAKGVPEETVIRKHALGNAWIPILTQLGGSLCMAIAGSAVIEAVFAWPGVGRLIVEAVAARDVDLTLGCVVMTTFIYVLVQLIVDLLYAFVDPKIKSQYTNTAKKKKQAAVAKPAEGLLAAAGQVPVTALETQGDEQSAAADAVPVALVNNAEDIASNEAQLSSQIKAGEAVLSGVDDIVTDTAEVEEQAERTYAAADTAPNEEKAAVVLQADSTQKQSSGKADKAKPDVRDDDVGLVVKKYKKRSQMGDIFHRILQNKGATVGLVIIALLLVIFCISLFISFDAVTETNARARLTPPSWEFPFGADNMGRNVFLRVIYGTRYSLAIGFGVVGIALIIGVFLGSIAGFFGGQVENTIMRCSDILASIPGMLLSMVIVTVLGQSLRNLIIAVGVTTIPSFIRITRASVLTIRNNEYIEAAHAIGFSNFRIIFSQVLPNGLSPIIVTFTASLGISIIIAASLSFIGFGVPVPHPEWGSMISTGREFARAAPYLMTFPGLFIMITVLAFNLLGDGLRDALDPKLKR